MLGDQKYPFMRDIDREWFIESLDLRGDATPLPDEDIVLRWVNGDHSNSVHVPEMGSEEFLDITGLNLNMHKGGFVMSKRLSRVMRPYFVWAFLDKIQINYDTSLDPKVYDGAGIVSRRFLIKMIRHLPPMKRSKRKAMVHHLRHSKRVEFTILTERGQDKGHAIVDEDMVEDFRLPLDTKKEVTLHKGEFCGIMFPHAVDTMRIDVQSMINLYPFINECHYLQWLHDDGQRYLDSVVDGTAGEMLAKSITPETTVDDLSWALAEYHFSGGQTMWFAGTVKGVCNQHIIQLERTYKGKMRLPVPGGRIYVMPDQVGIDAGMITDPVEYGFIRGDFEQNVAWVNAQEWCDYLADVWGGADNDDALWWIPFINEHREDRVIVWRSPNQLGEYIVLNPDDQCDVLPYNPPTLIEDDLPTRIDNTVTEYQNLVDPETAGGLGEGEDYSIPIIDLAIERGLDNAGTLGMYCNQLMLAKALYESLPDYPPAPLEDVIDASVKTGERLGAVKSWCYEYSGSIIKSGIPVPRFIVHRLAGGTEDVPETKDHWIDRVMNGVDAHIMWFENQRDTLAAQAVPPFQIMTYKTDAPGGKYIRAVNSKIAAYIRADVDPDWDEITKVAWDHIGLKPSDTIIAAIQHAYTVGKSDAAIWLMDITPITLKALRKLDIIDRVMDTEYGVITYPSAVPWQPDSYIVQINGVWFNWAKNNQPDLREMRDMEKMERNAWKELVAKTDWAGTQFTVTTDNERQVAIGAKGNLMGYIDMSTPIPNGEYVIRVATGKDGNLRVAVSPA